MLIGHVGLSLIIAFFSFGFLHTMSYSIAQRIEKYGFYGKAFTIDYTILSLIKSASFIGSVVIFLAIFIFLIGQKLSYILEINTAIHKLEGGNLSYRVPVVGDDEIAELASSLNQLAQTLEISIHNEEKLKMERMKLIQSLSHDIRTPLTAIISYTDFIQNKKYDSIEKLENYAGIIQSKAYQIKELTELLLDSNRDTKNGLIEEEVFDGKVLIEQLIQEHEEILEEEGFKVLASLQHLSPFKTSISPQDMVRIFDNLSSNIIKYAEVTEEVELAPMCEENVLKIIQTNTIRMEQTHVIESHGIGVRNIKQIANKYKGEINITQTDQTYRIEIELSI